MAGALTISTLNNDTGVLATQNGMTGISKAWVNYNGVSQTITGSFNVSSVTYNATGDYTVNFTTAMPNANYSATTGNQADSGADARLITTLKYNARTTTSASIFSIGASTNTRLNTEFVAIAIFSS